VLVVFVTESNVDRQAFQSFPIVLYVKTGGWMRGRNCHRSPCWTVPTQRSPQQHQRETLNPSTEAHLRIQPRVPNTLVTTDFSEGSKDALAYAFSLAQEDESEIILLHVAEVIDGVAVDLSGAYSEPSVKGIQKQLEDLVPDDARNGCDVVTRVGAHRVILELLENEKVDLLVMNIHGKGILDRALLGSTAERVVRGASCPVLLIPPMKNATSGSKSRVSPSAA